jgi:hypothetical protein
VIVTNASDQEVSAAAVLSVNDPVSFSAEPTLTTVNEGSNATFAVQASGAGRLDYQWLKNGQPIADATFSTLLLPKVTPATAGNYSCRVTNVVGTKTTVAGQLVVRAAPAIATAPAVLGRLVQKNARLSVSAQGAGNLTYQWLKDGVEIPGADGPELILLKLLELNSGVYSVRVSNDFASTEGVITDLSVFRWKQVAGTYQDVLILPNADSLGTTPFSGRVTVSISASGQVSGVVEYRGLRHSVKGVFSENLVLEKTVRRGALPPLSVRLQLNPAARSIDATVTHDDGATEFQSTALLPRNIYHATKNAAAQAGRYNVVLDPLGGTTPAPAIMTGVVLPSGRFSMRMELPDSRTLTSSGYLDPYGRIPLYAALFKPGAPGKGEIAGRLQISGTGVSRIVSGDASWHEPQLSKVVNLEFDAEGSIYQRLSGQAVIVLPPGSDLFSLQVVGPIPGSPISRWVRVLTPIKFAVDPETSEKMRFEAGPPSGHVLGTYYEAGTNRRRYIRGVTLQVQGVIRGFFEATPESAAFELIPYVQ